MKYKQPECLWEKKFMNFNYFPDKLTRRPIPDAALFFEGKEIYESLQIIVRIRCLSSDGYKDKALP
ncbi:MAG: hypothetical protein LKE64_10370 [Solobacterium sp.]|jgi:hypothetical protein|nr:hypothetical protein [Solobacterium sp.]